MAPHRNEWRPDTCGCIIEYEFDDEAAPEDRVHEVVEHDHSGCKLHKHLTTSKKLRYKRVLEENQRKNISYGLIVEHAKDNHPELLRGEGDDVQLIDGALVFQYDNSGVLGLRLPLHPTTSKRELQAILGKHHGAAKPVKVM